MIRFPQWRCSLDLTSEQVSWSGCGRFWNEILSSPSLSVVKINDLCERRPALEQWRPFSVWELPSVHLSPFWSRPPPSEPLLCGHHWTRVTQLMCPVLDNKQGLKWSHISLFIKDEYCFYFTAHLWAEFNADWKQRVHFFDLFNLFSYATFLCSGSFETQHVV